MIYLIEILLEFLSEIFMDLLFQLGFRRLVDIFKHPIIAGIVFGLISGFVSLLFFNELLITNVYLRVINLLVTPLVLGFIMSQLGKIYKRLGLPHSAIDSFAAGFCFAMAMTLVRFVYSVCT